MGLRAVLLGLLAVTAVVAASALAWLAVPHGQVVCVVENGTSQVADVTVNIYEKAYTARGLTPGGSFSFEFVPGADAHYAVSVSLAPEAGYEQDIGYVTSGVKLEHRMIVREKAIELTASTE